MTGITVISNETKLFTHDFDVIQAFQSDFCVINFVQLLSKDKTLRIWNAETGKAIRTLSGHTDAVYSVAFSPDSKRIVSGSSDKTLRLWDAETGTAIGKPLKGHTGEVWSVAFSPDGKRIVSGSADKTLRIWHISWEYLLPILCNQLKNHPSLKQPSTDVAWEAKETCEHFVWAKPAESTAKPSPTIQPSPSPVNSLSPKP